MNPLKIDPKNKQAITDELAAANKNAREHTFNEHLESQALAEQAESRLDELSLQKSLRPGAVLEAVSGKSVASTYSWARQATRVVLERRSRAWFLIHVSAAEIQQWGGRIKLHLTREQDEAAVSNLRSTYSLITPRTEESQASAQA